MLLSAMESTKRMVYSAIFPGVLYPTRWRTQQATACLQNEAFLATSLAERHQSHDATVKDECKCPKQ